MIIKQLYVDNALRNFNYLIACSETAQALVVDPLDVSRCLEQAKEQGWTITTIVNTHPHHDHIGGNRELIQATGAIVLAHVRAKHQIPEMHRGLEEGDEVCVGKSVRLKVLDTPGHMMTHICLFGEKENPPVLFCGDTLFNAGAGNCHSGDPEALYDTFDLILNQLPEETVVYPGHDYMENNLGFALDREPDNTAATAWLEKAHHQNPHAPYHTTLSLEKEINPFFRLSNPSLIANLRERFPSLSPEPSRKEVFLKLRQLRNAW